MASFQFPFQLTMMQKAKILNGLTGAYKATGTSSISLLAPISLLLPPRGTLSFEGSIRRSLDGVFDLNTKAAVNSVRLGNVRIEEFTASMRLTALPPFGNGSMVSALREFWGGNDKGSMSRYNNAALGRIAFGMFDAMKCSAEEQTESGRVWSCLQTSSDDTTFACWQAYKRARDGKRYIAEYCKCWPRRAASIQICH